MTSINPRAGNSFPQPLPETDCRSVSRNRRRMHRAVNRALTFFATEFPAKRSPKAPRPSRVKQSSLRLGGGGACGLAAQRAGLVERRLEESLAIAERDARLADRHAAVGFAFHAAVDRDDRI